MSDSDSSNIPAGYCQCGCGGKAPIATRTHAKYGHVKGKPVRFIRGHSIQQATDSRYAQRRREIAEEQAEHRRDWESSYPDIPYGSCLCACGQPTALGRSTDPARGLVYGAPKLFVSGHNRRIAWVDLSCSNCEATFQVRPGRAQNARFCSRSCAHEAEHKKATQMLETGYRVEPETGCWIWTAAKSRDDYAYVSRNKQSFAAYRLKWEQVHGPQPPGTALHHLCETPACVNPDHLQVLSKADHLRVHHAKLGLEDARKIRELHKRGRTQASIATEFGVDNSAISRIINGHKLTE